jgi:hypothetical protein
MRTMHGPCAWPERSRPATPLASSADREPCGHLGSLSLSARRTLPVDALRGMAAPGSRVVLLSPYSAISAFGDLAVRETNRIFSPSENCHKTGTASAARFGGARRPATECANRTAQILLPLAVMTEEFPPEHWENCALQDPSTRRAISGSPECRKILLEIAAGYECMADAARRFRKYGGALVEGIIPAASGVENTPPKAQAL